MIKKILLNGLKLILAAGLLWWLISSGKLNWTLLLEMRRYPHRLLLAFVFCAFNLLIATWRLRFLLQARSTLQLKLRELFALNWMGMFFSSVLPGSVTGDVVKVFYIQRIDPGFSKAFLLFVCLLDRVMGLMGLILMMGVFSLANYAALIELSPSLAPLLKFNFLLLSAVLLGLVVFFALPHWPQVILDKLTARYTNRSVLRRLGQLWTDLSAARPQIGKAITLSIFIQFLGAVIFYLLVSPQFQTELSLPMALSFIPLGFMAIALPISPAGLGVGHAAFEGLFQMAGEPNGANFFNMYFVVMLLFNVLGIIPWLAYRTRE